MQPGRAHVYLNTVSARHDSPLPSQHVMVAAAETDDVTEHVTASDDVETMIVQDEHGTEVFQHELSDDSQYSTGVS